MKQIIRNYLVKYTKRKQTHISTMFIWGGFHYLAFADWLIKIIETFSINRVDNILTWYK